jgi:S1-C subfamily serine protease
MHVAPASPAALAGWKTGDEITAVNGLSAMTLTERRALFGGAPGAKVTLVRRGGEATTLELKTYY